MDCLKASFIKYSLTLNQLSIMFRPNILRNYATMSFKQLFSFFINVVSKMTGNAFFPTPTPTMAALLLLLNAYDASIDDASNGDRLKITYRNDKQEEVIAALDELAIYVKTEGKENIYILQSSGFDLEKKGSPQYIGVLENAKFVVGKQSGTIVSECDGVKNVAAYIHYITSDAVVTPNTIWSALGTTSCKHVFDAVQPGARYWGYIQAIGRKDQVLTSPQFTIIAA